MSAKYHSKIEELIDLLEGELDPAKAAEIEAHLTECRSCRSCLESLQRTFSALARDTVPQPPPGYWEYFESRVRQRTKSQRRRLILTLAPGLTAVVVAFFLVWWVARTPQDLPSSMDLILADMSTGEIVESVTDSPALDDMFIQAAAQDLLSLEQYLDQTEGVDDLLRLLSDREKEELVLRLNRLMALESSLRLKHNNLTGKGC